MRWMATRSNGTGVIAAPRRMRNMPPRARIDVPHLELQPRFDRADVQLAPAADVVEHQTPAGKIEAGGQPVQLRPFDAEAAGHRRRGRQRARGARGRGAGRGPALAAPAPLARRRLPGSQEGGDETDARAVVHAGEPPAGLPRPQIANDDRQRVALDLDGGGQPVGPEHLDPFRVQDLEIGQRDLGRAAQQGGGDGR